MIETTSPRVPCQVIQEVNMNTAAMIILEELTLTLKQLDSMLDISERSIHTILTKKLNFTSHVVHMRSADF